MLFPNAMRRDHASRGDSAQAATPRRGSALRRFLDVARTIGVPRPTRTGSFSARLIFVVTPLHAIGGADPVRSFHRRINQPSLRPRGHAGTPARAFLARPLDARGDRPLWQRYPGLRGVYQFCNKHGISCLPLRCINLIEWIRAA
jgi:hypothetical protein